MPAPTGTAYPSGFDTTTSIGTAVSAGQTIASVYSNVGASAIIAIEQALGTNPEGSDATVAAALTARARKSDVQNQAVTFATDIGTANAYAIYLSPTPPTYTAGQMFTFVAAHANTGASTLAVNGQSAIAIVKSGGVAATEGDIIAGQVIQVVFDGTHFQLVGSAVTPSSIQFDTLVYAADTGSANAYAVTLSPTPASYAAGQVVVFKAANSNTGASTLAVNAQTAQSLLKNGGAALQSGDVVAGQVLYAIYDGAHFQLVNSLVTPSTLQFQSLVYAVDTGSSNAYAVSLSPAPAPYAAGQVVVFLASNGNSGASTLAVNGQSPQALVKTGGAALAQGDIIYGQLVQAVFDGSQFQMVGSQVTSSSIQTGSLLYSYDYGSANAYDIHFFPAAPAYTAGQFFTFVASNSNTGASTLQVDSQSAQALVKAGGAALEAGDIIGGQALVVMYDGSQFQLVGSPVTPSSIQSGGLIYAEDTGSSNAFEIALTPTPYTYTEGQMVVFKSAQTNTGPATLSVNGGTAENLVLNGGTPFSGGEIVTSQIVAAVFDGGQFQMVGSAAGSGGGLAVANTVNELRLSLQTGTPITADNIGGSTTIYFTPYTGGRIALYDTGSSSWQLWTTPELSIDITGYDTSYPWDMYLYNDSGTLTLTALEWSDGDTRATDIVLQDGVYVQSGAANYRWVGSFYLNPGDGNCYDNANSRFLFNAQNRVPHTVSTYCDNASTNANAWSYLIFPTVLVGLIAESMMFWGTALGQGDGVSAAVQIGIGVTTTAYSGGPDSYSAIGTSGLGTSFISATLGTVSPDIGLVYPTLYFQSTVSSSTVNLLDDGSSTPTTYLNGIVWG